MHSVCMSKKNCHFEFVIIFQNIHSLFLFYCTATALTTTLLSPYQCFLSSFFMWRCFGQQQLYIIQSINSSYSQTAKNPNCLFSTQAESKGSKLNRKAATVATNKHGLDKKDECLQATTTASMEKP